MQIIFKLNLFIFLFTILVSCSKDPESLINTSEDHIVDIDGNIYQTVKLGNQVWMKENLRVTHYHNGDIIPNVSDSLQWWMLQSGGYCNYNNDEINTETNGRLYNWYAVSDGRMIAPERWHISSDQEWEELEMYLGMNEDEMDTTGWRGKDEGSKLKDISGWINNGNGTNSSGFSALPGGCRSYSGPFLFQGIQGYWWSATESNRGNSVWYRSLINNDSTIYRYSGSKKLGLSIHCVKD